MDTARTSPPDEELFSTSANGANEDSTKYPLPYITPSNLKDLPVSLPACSPDALSLPASKLEAIATDLIECLSHPQSHHFSSTTTPLWRDIHALTSTFRTFYTASSIITAWSDTTSVRHATDIAFTPGTIKVNDFPGGIGWVDATFTFTCEAVPQTICEGYLSISPESDENGDLQWKIWMLRTILKDLRSGPSVDELSPIPPPSTGDAPNGAPNGALENNTSSTSTSTTINPNAIDPNPHLDVLIIGAGPAGLSLSSRLLALSNPTLYTRPISHLLLSKDHPSHGIGGSWLTRYASAKLHTIREYSHLPYDRTFTAEEFEGREWMTAQDLGRGYAAWARKFGVDKCVRLGWEVVGGVYDSEMKVWRVQVKRVVESTGDGGGELAATREQSNGSSSDPQTSNGTHEQQRDGTQEITITTTHLILATGSGGHHPSIPLLPHSSLYTGTTIHSATYHSSHPYQGLHGLVIGTANTAHDIAADMLVANLKSVTMLQRRTTYVLPTEYFSRIAERSYNPHVKTEVADQLGMSTPWAIGRLLAMKGLHAQASQEPERFDALERAGYSVERYGDIFWHIAERMGGHYMDMGNCQSIADGHIRVKGGVPKKWTQKGLVVDMGGGREEEVEADVVVFATGFERSAKRDVERLFGREVSERCEEFWGVDGEGEVRGVWKRSGHPGLWLHGGTLGHARYFSRFIALQIKADLDGTPMPVYTKKV